MPAIVSGAEIWRTSLGGFTPHCGVPLSGGIVLGGTARFDSEIEPPDGIDSLIVTISGEGRILEEEFELRVKGITRLLDLAVVDDRVLALVDIEDALVIGAETLAARPCARGSSEVERLIAVVEIGRRRGPQRATIIYRGTAHIAGFITAVRSGDYVVALTEFHDKRQKVTVARHSVDGARCWQRDFLGLAVQTRMSALDANRLAINLRGQDRLAVWILAIEDGAEIALHELHNISLGGHVYPGNRSGQLGAIHAMVADASTLWACGETGGSVKVGGKTIKRPLSTLRYPYTQPFVLKVSDDGVAFTDLVPASGEAWLVHRWSSHLVIGYTVENPLEGKLPRPGTYLACYEQEFTPVSHIEEILAVSAVAEGSTLFVWGTCPRPPLRELGYCITKHVLSVR